MKHTIRDSIIFLIHILGLSALYRAYMRTKGPLVRVVCFHDVEDASWFDEVITMFVQRYHILTPVQFHERELNQEKINVLLTFDDGYRSWIDICLPILKKNNIKGLFFINSGLLDIADDAAKIEKYMRERLLITPKRALTWDDARRLLVLDHTIGGHTVTHPNLALLDDLNLTREIQQDKDAIEAKLDIKLVDFAYPFGTSNFFSKATISEVARAGYTTQYSALSGFELEGDCVPRLLLEKKQSKTSISYWISGSYDIFSQLPR